jgi:hypothetical protein
MEPVDELTMVEAFDKWAVEPSEEENNRHDELMAEIEEGRYGLRLVKS